MRQQAAHSILQQATFNFPKLHLLSHYSLQIVDFGTLPQYYTEVTEALHKPLKDAYRSSNRVDAAEPILDTINRDYAIRMRELNLIAWSEEIQLPPEVLEILDITKDSPSTTRRRATIICRPTLGDKQSTDNPNGDCLLSLSVTLGIPSLPERFLNYLKLNAPRVEPPLALSEISQYRAHHYASLSVPIIQFQGHQKLNHQVRCTGQRNFRQRSENRADWVWVCMRERMPVDFQRGQLDGRMVGRLEGLFSVQDELSKVHQVALVGLLRLRGPAKAGGEEGMIRVESREEGKDYILYE